MSGVKGKSGRKSKAWHAAQAAAKALAEGRPAVEVAQAATVEASKVIKRRVMKDGKPVEPAQAEPVAEPSAALDVGEGVTDSREFLELVIADPRVPISVRVRAASTLAQYQHTRTVHGGKKENAQERAQAVVKGEARGEEPRRNKYAPAAPPHGLGLIRGGKVA